MCMLSFADGIHCDFHLYTKIIFLGNVFIQTKSKKNQSCLCVDFFKAEIMRALLSNKTVFFALLENDNIAYKRQLQKYHEKSLNVKCMAFCI